MYKGTFTCYFCNQTIQNESQQGHAAVCGAVLEPCPNKCGSYIARNQKMNHMKACINNPKTINRDYNRSLPTQKQSLIPNHNVELEKKLHFMTTSLNDTLHNQQRELAQLKSENLRMTNQQQNILEFYSKTQMHLDSLRSKVNTDFANLQQDNSVTIHNMKESIKEFERINFALGTLKVSFKEEQLFVRDGIKNLEKSIEECKDMQEQENNTMGALFNELKEDLKVLREQNNGLEKVLQDLEEKYKALGFEIRTANELSADCLTKIEKQNGVIEGIKNTLTQMKLDVELTEDTFSNIQGLIATKPGRIIWKLTDFEMKMEVAKKDSKVPLKGPIFYTKDYGYRIRLLVYLNGFKKWKGRHMLACFHVMKGEYDNLLKWPCKIEANVILKDVGYEETPKDYARFITAKRESPNDEAEDPQESSTQYIFIPHSTLMKSNYLKDDALFIEIVINEQRQTNETNM